MAYILNDDFNGGTWVDSSGTTHSGSSGVANTLPSTAIWNIATGVAGSSFNGSGELVYYPGTTTYVFQDGSSNLCLAMGKQNTGGASGGLYPSGYVDTSKSPGPQTVGVPKYAVQPNQSCEIKCKVNPINGLWTACWFLEGNGQYGTNTYGEIDMEEAGDGGSSNPQPGSSQVTIWGGSGGGQDQFGTGGIVNVGDGNYHIFRLDLLDGGNTISIYHLTGNGPMTAANQTLIYTLTAAQGEAAQPSAGWPFTPATGLYAILQLHMDASVSGTPVASALPATGLLVDYVRIWSPAGPDPNSSGANVTVSGSIAVPKPALSGSASNVASGTTSCTGSIAVPKPTLAGAVNSGGGGSGGNSTASLTDAFSSNDLAANWANSYGTYNVTNAHFLMQCDNSYSSGLSSTNNYNLTGSYVYGQFLPYQTANSETGLQLYLDATDLIVISYAGGNMVTTLTQAGVTTNGPVVTYSPTQHAWWQISELNGTLTFSTAPDGVSWTTLWTTTYTINVTALTISAYAGNYATEPTGTSYITNINTQAPAALTLTDTFASNDLSTVWSWNYGTVSVSGNQCSIQADSSFSSGIISSTTYNLIGSQVAAQILPYAVATGETGLQLSDSDPVAGNYFQIAYVAGQLQFNMRYNGTVTSGSPVPYSSLTHAFWRIREASGTVYFETAPDGATWVTQWSAAYSFGVSSLMAQVYAGVDGTSNPTGTAYVNTVNVPPITCSGSIAVPKPSLSGTNAPSATSTGSIAVPKPTLSGSATITPGFAALGTPTLTRATSGSVTPVFGTGQSDNVGDLLVAVVTAAAATSVTTISTPSGWTLIAGSGNTATAHSYTAMYWKIAAGSDTLPAFTSTLSGTGAMTATIVELTSPDLLGPVDSWGVYASGSSAGTIASTASTATTCAGTIAISGFNMERATGTNTWTDAGTGFSNLVNDGATNSVSHTAVDINAAFTGAIGAEVTATDHGSWTTQTTAYGSGVVAVFFGTAAPQLAASTLVDTFTVNDLATLWDQTYGTVAVSGNRCSIQCDTSFSSGLQSTGYFDIRGTYLYAQLSPYIAASAQTGLQLYLDQGNTATIYYSAGIMATQIEESGVVTAGSTVTYNATNHAWWQIIESLGTLYFQTAPDGATWTTLWSTTYTFDASRFLVQCYAGDFGSDATGTSYIDNVNVAGSSVTSGSIAVPKPAMSGSALVASAGTTQCAGSIAVPKPAMSGSVNNFTGTMTSGSIAVPKPSMAGTANVVNPTLFPVTPLTILVEAYLNGAWTDITSQVYQRTPIQINRGRPDESQSLNPGQMSLTLNNRNGQFSPRNPAGPYYGSFGRNTPIRLSASNDPTQMTGLVYRFYGEVPAWPPQWDNTGSDVYVQIAAAGIMRRLGQSYSTALQPALTRYFQNNAASLSLAAYWACNDASGSTSLASSVAGVNPMHINGSPQLASDSSFAGAGSIPQLSNSSWSGYLGASSLSSSISTTVITTPGSGTIRVPSSISKAIIQLWGAGGGGGGEDALGQGYPGGGGGGGGYATSSNFAVTPGGLITYNLAAGGLSGIAGANGNNGANSTVTGASGTLTAIGGVGGTHGTTNGGGTPGGGGAGGGFSGSPTGYRGGNGSNGSPKGGAGGGGGTSAGYLANGISATGQAQTTAPAGGGYGGHADQGGGYPGGGAGGADNALSGTKSGQAGGAQLIVSWHTGAGSTTASTIMRFLLDVPAAGDTPGVVARMYTQGTVAQVDVVYGTGGTLEIIGYTTTGGSPAVAFDSGAVAFNVNGNPVIVSAELNQSGTGIAWGLNTIYPGENQVQVGYGGTLANAYTSTVSSVAVNPNASLSASSVGGVAIQYIESSLVELAYAVAGYAGEQAAGRFLRICGEVGVATELQGNVGDTVAMGPQPASTLISILTECEAADHGLLYEPRDLLGLGYRTHTDMSNQTPQVALDYSLAQLVSPLAPTDDDQLLANDIIVTRSGGSSFELQDTTDALSVQQAPGGVGVYQKSYTANVQFDSMLDDQAGWYLSAGTVNQQRFPSVSVDLTRSESVPIFTPAQVGDAGDLLTIANLPSWMPPGTVQQLLFGFTETLDPWTWTIEWNCVPALPYFTGVIGDPVYSQVDTVGSSLHTAVNTTATTLVVDTTDVNLWTTSPASFPFAISLNGEEMTVTNITGTATPQNFTVIRAVNGVSLSHVAGESVSLAFPTIVGL